VLWGLSTPAGRFFATVERTFFQTQRLENRTYCSLLPEARSRSVWTRQAALKQQGVDASDHLLFPSQFVPTRAGAARPRAPRRGPDAPAQLESTDRSRASVARWTIQQTLYGSWPVSIDPAVACVDQPAHPLYAGRRI